MTHPDEPTIPGERLVTQFTPEQRGWMTVALVAFLGVAILGPAITQATTSGARLRKTAMRRVRRFGGAGPMTSVFGNGR